MGQRLRGRARRNELPDPAGGRAGQTQKWQRDPQSPQRSSPAQRGGFLVPKAFPRDSRALPTRVSLRTGAQRCPSQTVRPRGLICSQQALACRLLWKQAGDAGPWRGPAKPQDSRAGPVTFPWTAFHPCPCDRGCEVWGAARLTEPLRWEGPWLPLHPPANRKEGSLAGPWEISRSSGSPAPS